MNSAGESAQQGTVQGSENIQSTAANLPLVGDVKKGLGETPLAQKLTGQEGDEMKGYLSSAVDSANQVVSFLSSW